MKRAWHLFLLEIPHPELSGDFEPVGINELIIINGPVFYISWTQHEDLSFAGRDELAPMSCANGSKSRFIVIISNL